MELYYQRRSKFFSRDCRWLRVCRIVGWYLVLFEMLCQARKCGVTLLVAILIHLLQLLEGLFTWDLGIMIVYAFGIPSD